MAIADWHKIKLPWAVGPYVGNYHPSSDPREVLKRRLGHANPEGWVMVKESEIRDVYEMRVCRAAREFDRDEDGPTPAFTANCVYEAGHRDHHSNGYYTWAADER